ncbi:MAG: histidine phosphatase family protein [Chloroflexi bacterium]|nr:histidine phosphatase family protein [Chloroflexota bacterium]
MNHLILIRHAETYPDPALPSAEWPLTSTAVAQCIQLSRRLQGFRPAYVAASPEPKAVRTAELVAMRFDLDVLVYDGLHEHDRSGEPFIESVADFQSMMEAVFNHPDECVYGTESAVEALERFEMAVADVLADAPDEGDVFIVSHGTVNTLFCSRHMDVDPYPFWLAMGMPSYVVFTLPDYIVLEIVEDID